MVALLRVRDVEVGLREVGDAVLAARERVREGRDAAGGDFDAASQRDALREEAAEDVGRVVPVTRDVPRDGGGRRRRGGRREAPAMAAISLVGEGQLLDDTSRLY